MRYTFEIQKICTSGGYHRMPYTTTTRVTVTASSAEAAEAKVRRRLRGEPRNKMMRKARCRLTIYPYRPGVGGVSAARRRR